MTKIDLNTSPYFDDYTESKKFYKILFRPGRAIQARELTQIQSIIQNQIARFGKHIFKNFALVSPRPSLGCKYDPTTVFVKIPASAEARTQTENNLNNYWVNKKVRNQAGVEGLIIGYHKDDAWVRLFISLEKAGVNANNFARKDTITVSVEDVLPDGTTSLTTTLSATIEDTTNAVGRIASVEIPDSIYFYEDYFVLVDRQWLFVTPENVSDDLAWNASPTCEIGIQMTQSKVTFEDDESLLDNATGASNFAAPGADRLKIEGKLDVKQLNSTDQDFIKLLTVSRGIITRAWQLETDPYNDPYKAILAKRTFDESGNYTTKPFIVESRPFLASDNKGLFTEDALSVPYEVGDELSEMLAKEKAIQIAKDVFELTWADSEDPKIVSYNGRYYPGTSYDTASDVESFKKLCDDRLGLRFQPGSGYVEGYFQQKSVITNLSIKKSRTSDFLQNKTIQTPKGTQFLIKNVVGMPPIQDVGNTNLSYDQVELHSVVLTDRDTTPSASTKIGTARVYSIALYSGTNGSFNAVYALGIFDINFIEGYNTRDLSSIYYPGGSTSGSFLANLLFKDVTTNPSLRFTGTISKYTRKSKTNVSFTTSTPTTANPTATSVLSFVYSTEAEQLSALNSDYTPGTFLSITDGATTTERTVVSVESSLYEKTYNNVTFDANNETSRLKFEFASANARDIALSNDLRVGSVITLKDTINTTLKTTTRTITSVTNTGTSDVYVAVDSSLAATDAVTPIEQVIISGYKVEVTVNEALPSASFISPLTKVETSRKVKGVGTLWKSNAGEKLEKGDQVAIGTGDKMRIYTVYSNPSNDNELSLEPDPTVATNAPWDDGATMNYLVSESILDSSLSNAGLVYRLPHTDVRAVRGGTKGTPLYSSIATRYVTTRYVIAAKSGGSPGSAISATGVTYTLPASNERFEQGLSNYSLIDLERGYWFELFPFNSGNVGSIAVGADANVYRAEVKFNGNQVQFLVNIGDSTTNNNRRFGVVVSVEKSLDGAREGKKTLIKGRFTGGDKSAYAGGTVVFVNDNDNKRISLGVPDVLQVTRIVESPNLTKDPSNLETLPDGHKDVTFKYTLDNGQRDYYYGIAELQLRPGYDRPTGRLRIEFDYFQHSVTGDYFSVDSYPWNISTLDAGQTEVQMTYDDIPEYASEKYGKYDLKCCLDFRPVCLEGTDATQNGRYAFNVYRELPLQDVTCSYHVYEERKDKVYLDKDGRIKVKYGVPGLLAATPEDPADGMVLYDVQMLPYTEDYRKCILRMRDNRRYTMRDIGKIEERVKNLEYYTSLSLLESDTSNLVIKDALGQDKFKHGFMVDNFANESVYDTEHPDSTAALDKLSGELKPRCFDNHLNLIETYSLSRYTLDQPSEVKRANNNYTETGGLYTLNYTNVQYMEQPLASRLININPYQVQTFMGILKISPWTDTWRDTVVSEPLVVYDTSAYDYARQQFDQNGEKTDWHGTKTDWQGLDIEQEKTGTHVVAAGHSWPAKDGKYLDPKTGDLINGTGIPKKGQQVRIPEGWPDAGQKVRYQHQGSGQDIYTNTVSMKGEQYATGIKSSIVDGGFSAPVSMGTRLIDTRAADHIRSNEIKFEGKCFLPNSKLYAFFDGVNVSKYCIPDIDYGSKKETSASIRRGPYTGLSCTFVQNTITISGNKSTDAGDQLKKSDGTPAAETTRAGTLVGLSYDDIAIFAPAPGENAPDLDFVGCKLTGTVKLLRNETDEKIQNVVEPGHYYLLGTGTKFKTELVASATQRSVVLIPGLKAEYQIKQDGLSSDTLALVETPYMRTGEPITKYVMVASDTARECVDLLEVLQKLYAKKYLDVAGSTNSKHNVNNKEIVQADYLPATGTNNLARLVLTVDNKVDFGSTQTASITLKIKNTSTDKDIGDPNTLTLQCDSSGKIKGKFVIPDPKVDGNPRFRVGERIFRLTNSSTNEEAPTVSRAESKYNASGWIDVKQEQLYSTKQFKVDSQYVEGNRTPVSLSDTFESAGKVCPRDPLAQSFTVSEPTGIFLTAVDVFFYSKDPVLPVILQIRPLDDGGNPSINLIHEMTLDSADVVINKLDLTTQKLTVIGNPNGKDGFNKGPWRTTPSGDNIGLYHVTSKNQATGKNTAEIQHNVQFTYTTSNGVATPCDDMIPTRFVFDHPIYLPGNNNNYCFVLLTDSIQAPGTGIETLAQTYQVYMAQTGASPVTELSNTPTATPIHLLTALEPGEDDYNYILGTQTRLNTIPGSDGVLFKSINGISWESDQKADLKYKLFRANFNTARNAQIEFVNEKLSIVPLIYDPFETVAGKSQVRVYHRNHNIPANTGKVRFVGLPQNANLNGIPYQLLARPEGHTVLNPTLDSYIIDLGTITATETGRIGGRTVAATGHIRFEEFLVRANPIIPKDTEIVWKFLGTTAKAAYDPDSVPWLPTDEIGFKHNTNVTLPQSSMVCSPMNEDLKLNSSTHKPGVGNSIKVVAYLSSKSPYISPILDSERVAVDLKGIRLDDPVGTGEEYNNINNSDFDTVRVLPTTATPAVSSLAGKIYFSDTDNKLTGSSFYFEGKKVVGVGTLFSSELTVGDIIKHPMFDDTRKIIEIISDTEMYINEEFPLSQIKDGVKDKGGTATLFYNPPYLRIKTADRDVAAHLSTLDVGKYLSASDTTTGKRDFTNKKILKVTYTPTSTLTDQELTSAHKSTKQCLCEIMVEHRQNDNATPGLEGAATFTLKQLNNYIDEIAPMGGSVASKYVAKTMKLTESANTLKVMFDGCRPKNAKIELYYKVGSDADQESFYNKNWTKLEYTIETNGVLEELTPTENPTLLSFSSYEANALNLPPFTLAKVKIVLRGGHTPLYPKVKNLRVIALEE